MFMKWEIAHRYLHEGKEKEENKWEISVGFHYNYLYYFKIKE